MADSYVFLYGENGVLLRVKATDIGGGLFAITTAGAGGGVGSTQVQGMAADGAAPVGNPVWVGGFDGANIQALLTTLSGQLQNALYIQTTNPGDEIIKSDGAGTGTPRVALYNGGASLAITAANADGVTGAAVGFVTRAYQFNQIGTSTFDRVRTPAKFTTFSLGIATAETTIWTPAAGKKFRLMGGIITATVATVLTFKDNTAGTTIFVLSMNAGVPFDISGMGNGILSAAANNVLTVTRSVASALDGTLFGTEE